MEETIMAIPIENITPRPGNRRIGGFEKTRLKQLADSIKAVGVQQPAVVRHRTDDTYELVTGERRWRACSLAKVKTLPCVVRDLDDVTVLKIRTIENLQREDIHPLDEAEGFQRLMEQARMTADQVAEAICQTRSYVYHRLKLCALAPAPRHALMKEQITVGHAELIARLPQEYQQQALKLCNTETWFSGRSKKLLIPVKDARKRIAQELFLELEAAPFSMADADLVPEAGPCMSCPKQTGNNRELFPEVAKKDCCMDDACYRRKMRALVGRRRQELETSGEEFVEAQGSYPWSDRDEEPEEAVPSWYWEECEQKEEGAKRILVVSGPEKGKVTYGKINEEQLQQTREEWKLDQALREHEQNRIKEFCRRLFKEVREAYMTKGKKWSIPSSELRYVLLQFYDRLSLRYRSHETICTWHGWQRPPKEDYENQWERPGFEEVGKAKISELGDMDLQILLIECALVQDITDIPYDLTEEDERFDDIRELAQELEVDVNRIRLEVTEKYDRQWEKIRAKMEKKEGEKAPA